MPYTLLEHGLLQALRELTKKIQNAGLLNVELKIELEERRFEPSTESALYRIVQEVLNNMIKHSKARNIAITLTEVNQVLRLKIEDDGIGFDTALIEKSEGIGWKNIVSRVLTLDGKINVNSDLGKGTSVNIDLGVTAA